MTLKVTQETFDSLTDEWRTLAEACHAPVFATPAWLRTWWDSCRSTEELMLLAFREGNEAKGIAPLMRIDDTIRFIAYSDICDYHDFPFSGIGGGEFYTSLLDELDRTAWRSLELDGLTEDSPTLQALPELAKGRGWSVDVALEEVSPRIPVQPTWEEYQNALGKKDRHELRRKLRRLGAAGDINYYNVTNPRSGDVADVLTLLKASREAKAAFLTPEKERFFHNLAESMAEQNHLKLFFLELDGVRVAASFCFDYKKGYYLYNSGYDVHYAQLSVGLLLKALCLKSAIEDGKEVFDLLRGSESYKYHLGAQDYGVHRLTIQR